jgi:hypothetical protein
MTPPFEATIEKFCACASSYAGRAVPLLYFVSLILLKAADLNRWPKVLGTVAATLAQLPKRVRMKAVGA